MTILTLVTQALANAGSAALVAGSARAALKLRAGEPIRAGLIGETIDRLLRLAPVSGAAQTILAG